MQQPDPTYSRLEYSDIDNHTDQLAPTCSFDIYHVLVPRNAASLLCIVDMPLLSLVGVLLVLAGWTLVLLTFDLIAYRTALRAVSSDQWRLESRRPLSPTLL
jgi:hypothetical protein